MTAAAVVPPAGWSRSRSGVAGVKLGGGLLVEVALGALGVWVAGVELGGGGEIQL